MTHLEIAVRWASGKWASLSKAHVAVVAFVLAAVAGMVALQVRDHPQLSPVDELQHLDYVLKSPSGGVRIGEQYGVEAMVVVACRGIGWPGWAPGTPNLPECGDPRPYRYLSPSDWHNTAYVHTPVYYSATALAGEAVLRLPGVDNSLTAYRLVGTAWLAAGLALVWYALGLVGVGIAGRAAVVGLLGVSPVVVHASAFLNPDATALFGGGLLVVALLKWESGRWPWWTVTAASAVAVWLKLTNALAVGLLAVYLAIRIWQEWDRRELDRVGARARGRILAGSSSALAAVVPVLVWRLWQGHRRLVEERDLPIYANQRHDSFQWTSLDEKLRAVVTPFRDPWIPDGLSRSLIAPLGGLADVGLLVLLGATVAFTAAKSAHRALVGGVFAAMAGMGVLTMIANYMTLSRDPPVPGRYGLAILPFAAVAAAPVLRRHVLARALVGILAFATAGAMLSGVLVEG